MSNQTAQQISKKLIKCFEGGNKLLICGNGGSASQSIHFACELVCTFGNKERDPLPAISLAENPSILTAWSNDFLFETVFARQISALGKTGDCLVVLSTSGKSKNCLLAIKAAEDAGLSVVDFPREGKDTAEIQEYQLHLMHQVCRLIDEYYT
jgi:D-sedoheptulose 7-phosphate isomerase